MVLIGRILLNIKIFGDHLISLNCEAKLDVCHYWGFKGTIWTPYKYGV